MQKESLLFFSFPSDSNFAFKKTQNYKKTSEKTNLSKLFTRITFSFSLSARRGAG